MYRNISNIESSSSEDFRHNKSRNEEYSNRIIIFGYIAIAIAVGAAAIVSI